MIQGSQGSRTASGLPHQSRSLGTVGDVSQGLLNYHCLAAGAGKGLVAAALEGATAETASQCSPRSAPPGSTWLHLSRAGSPFGAPCCPAVSGHTVALRYRFPPCALSRAVSDVQSQPDARQALTAAQARRFCRASCVQQTSGTAATFRHVASAGFQQQSSPCSGCTPWRGIGPSRRPCRDHTQWALDGPLC
jgi:hypothetical protein